jgi:hypothetical protein
MLRPCVHALGTRIDAADRHDMMLGINLDDVAEGKDVRKHLALFCDRPR